MGLVQWGIVFSFFGWSTSVFASEGRDVYKQSCAVCHSVGMPGTAPRLGISADWKSRLITGRKALLHSVLNGHRGMPPKGGDASLSDAQAEAALDYMLSEAVLPK